MGICSDFPTPMRHSLPKALVIDILDFILEQEIDKLTVILNHSIASTLMGFFSEVTWKSIN